MPADLVQTLNGWVNDAVAALATDGRLATLGIEPAALTPQQFAQFAAADLDRGTKLLQAAHFEPQ
jgi:tripartite-type tricarboxylate transporter receptor subunit TctC